MSKQTRPTLWPRRTALTLALGLGCAASPPPAAAKTPSKSDLEARVARLEAALADADRRLRAAQDVQAIERLQRIYGYYIDKAQWDQIPLLFTEDCEIEINRGGVFVGPQAWEKLRYASPQGGQQGLEDGMLFNHMILQGVVDIVEEDRIAKGRWRCLLQMARWGKWAADSEGLYENTYEKVDGRWLIKKMVYAQTFTADPTLGYAKDSGASMPPPVKLPGPSDRPSSIPDQKAWPRTYMLPYHFPNPGRPAR